MDKFTKQSEGRRIRPTAFLAQKYLAGIRYPADKGRILETARSHGADLHTLRVLSALPEMPYISPVALAVAIGRME